ncbi:MAG: UDP-N-acetyl-D-glucosamine dehydrogenase, partial [Francisellaceae bacterium]
MSRIAIIGLGYVGLPLALQAEVKGMKVIGLDLDSEKIRQLQAKKTGFDDKLVSKRLKKSKINFVSDFRKLKNVDIAIICVPTPVSEDKIPDLSIVKSASLTAANHMKNGSLLIIESTINPGVCNEVLIPLIEKETIHKIDKTLGIAHCPERINPGDLKWHVGNINRVVGADTKESLDLAYDFYSKIIDAEIKKMGSLKEAEAVKIVENTFRDINIAFVNELAMSFAKLGINVNNVIDGAATKPFAFMPHYPGIGVGGHCIPVDPYYLIEHAASNGFDHNFLKIARAINESMPVYVIDQLEEALIECGQGTLKSKNIVVLGISYKPNVGDHRESPTFVIIDELKNRGAVVEAYDPYIPDKSSNKPLDQLLKECDVV